jgi:hypothetical protein
VDALGARIQVSTPHLSVMQESADALDAVIAIFAGVAAHSGHLAVPPEKGPEGAIAVHI